MTTARFVGIGVGEYDQGHPALGHAVPDVEAVAGLLDRAFDCTLLRNPDEQSAKDCLAGLRGSMAGGGTLVLLWSGHAIPSAVDGLRLLARDSKAFGHLAGATSMTGSSPFLQARLVTDQLRAAPADTSQPGWQDTVSHSVEDAFDTDLARVRAPSGARTLLAALTWGFGAGLPEEEWLACANAIGDGGFGPSDVSWVLDELGRYIIQDGEAGVAVYRIAHQSLADHIRPPFAASYQQVFDPRRCRSPRLCLNATTPC